MKNNRDDFGDLEDIDFIKNFVTDQKELYDRAKKFQLHFLFDALRTVLNEAELKVFHSQSLDWIWEEMYNQLKSKAETAEMHYALGVFIYALCQNGSSANAAIIATAEWLCIADTSCKNAFFEIRKLAETDAGKFWFSREGNGVLALSHLKGRTKRQFLSNTPQTMKAFNALFSEYQEISASSRQLSSGVGAAKKQIRSNRSVRKHRPD